MKPDAFDGLVIIGLLLLVTGIGMISIPAALITGGGCLMATGIYGAWLKGQKSHAPKK